MKVEVFFGTRPDELAGAKAICRGCPVRVTCLEEAMADPGLRGVWGGTSTRERQLARRSGSHLHPDDAA
jgi:hypothetical protein